MLAGSGVSSSFPGHLSATSQAEHPVLSSSSVEGWGHAPSAQLTVFRGRVVAGERMGARPGPEGDLAAVPRSD